MRGLSRIRALGLVVGVGATLAVVPMAPASAGTTNNPLTVTGTVRCQVGSAESLLITGGGESHGASVGVGGRFSVVFGNPQLPSIATAQVRCDIAGNRTYRSTNFTMYRPVVGQVLNVTLTVL
ncbi:hypothetical protein Ga0074812_102408 [Parafrankia irregularis]|uniref:Neocarzinostatin family protein n=1 Tax=Parafrankia irregularis TaxID=795642 RepID=A0A0S4QGP0_9ACTN|nr:MULTISPECIES: hypothetical protein [Parafrankia]MBE3202972.1 hypothetical protein [Parafrankia sp. CH37]CUU54398.1 hypothetical protein Ga0074812_102408 [Parafrankia irregularis]